MSRFICRFAVGRDGLAYSGVWRVWTAKKKPDLYISIRTLGGELKATVHAPYPPHQGWKRHLGFPMEAASLVSQEAKRHGGPHKLSWTGCQIGHETTVEYRVSIRGTSLEKVGHPVGKDVALLPIPSPDEYVEVIVILGPTGPTPGYPRERDEETILLDEGRLLDGRVVWVVYIIRPVQKNETKTPVERNPITPESSFIDPNADLNSGTLRAVGFGASPDGSLVLYDFKATFRPPS